MKKQQNSRLLEPNRNENYCEKCKKIKKGRNGLMCREIGILFNERDLISPVKCKYYVPNN